MKLKVNWTRVKKMYVVFYRGSITKFQIIKAVAGVQKQVYYCIDNEGQGLLQAVDLISVGHIELFYLYGFYLEEVMA